MLSLYSLEAVLRRLYTDLVFTANVSAQYRGVLLFLSSLQTLSTLGTWRRLLRGYRKASARSLEALLSDAAARWRLENHRVLHQSLCSGSARLSHTAARFLRRFASSHPGLFNWAVDAWLLTLGDVVALFFVNIVVYIDQACRLRYVRCW